MSPGVRSVHRRSLGGSTFSPSSRRIQRLRLPVRPLAEVRCNGRARSCRRGTSPASSGWCTRARSRSRCPGRPDSGSRAAPPPSARFRGRARTRTRARGRRRSRARRREYAWSHAFRCGSVRRQLMHEYVQKSTSTTFPRRPASDSGASPGVLSQSSMPRSSGARGSLGSVVVGGERIARVGQLARARVRRPSVRSTCSWSASVYPGTAVVNRWSAPSAIAIALAPIAAPATLRVASACVRSRPTSGRRAAGCRSRWRASAARRRARTTPVTRTMRAPTSPVAASAVIAARTGPAQGTKTSPRLSPSTKPFASAATRVRVRKRNGRSRTARRRAARAGSPRGRAARRSRGRAAGPRAGRAR